MRRHLPIFLAFVASCYLQLSWLNRLSENATFNLPLTLLLLSLPFLKRSQQIVAILGASLPLDYASVLPFGSYLLSFSITSIIFHTLCQRLPMKSNRLLHLGLIGIGSITVFVSLLGLTTLAGLIRLAPWQLSSDIRELFLALTTLTGFNCLLALGCYVFGRFAQRLVAHRFLIPHATR